MTETLVPTAADLVSRAGDSISPERARLIEEAYTFAEHAHEGQSRKTGEPYFVHPIDAAMTVAELKLDGAAIAAALPILRSRRSSVRTWRGWSKA
jgi:GTP pyrophosphokinase